MNYYLLINSPYFGTDPLIIRYILNIFEMAKVIQENDPLVAEVPARLPRSAN